MKFNKVFKGLAIAVPVMVLAACSSTPDDRSAETADQEQQMTEEQRRAAQAGAADRVLSPEEERQQRYAELRQEHIIYFDFDDSTVKGEFAELLSAHADYLVRNPSVSVVIEGHTDERGTPEYNIALGERRANAVVNYLQNLGVQSRQLETVSYGEEKPLVRQSNERAWAQNRRAVLVY